MFIPTAAGTNTAGATVGPSTTNWMLPLDLYQVSTIAPGNTTRQLTLADLGTDCPQTADPTAIATMVDSRCDPVLAAPSQVRSWAYPCNACGRFGLFDPPYAVPTITGALVETTVVPPPPPPVTVTAVPTPAPTFVPPPPPPPGTGLIFIVYCDTEGKPFGTATVTAPGVAGTVTSSVTVPVSSSCVASQTATSTGEVATSAVTTAAGVRREVGGGMWWVAGVVGGVLL
jgi:hypothetical protein